MFHYNPRLWNQTVELWISERVLYHPIFDIMTIRPSHFDLHSLCHGGGEGGETAESTHVLALLLRIGLLQV